MVRLSCTQLWGTDSSSLAHTLPYACHGCASRVGRRHDETTASLRLARTKGTKPTKRTKATSQLSTVLPVCGDAGLRPALDEVRAGQVTRRQSLAWGPCDLPRPPF